MFFSEKDEFLIREILESIDLIFQFIDNMAQLEFARDLKTQAAATMMIQRIGEAGSKLSNHARQKNKLDWNIICELRNRISHAYGSIDHEIIWSVIKNDLRHVRGQVSKLLEPH